MKKLVSIVGVVGLMISVSAFARGEGAGPGFTQFSDSFDNGPTLIESGFNTIDAHGISAGDGAEAQSRTLHITCHRSDGQDVLIHVIVQQNGQDVGCQTVNNANSNNFNTLCANHAVGGGRAGLSDCTETVR